MKIETRYVAELIPYENNPRRNDQAVDAVAESIRQCGYCSPIIVDEENVVLAGHTRLKAVAKLGWREVEVCVKAGLTEEQKRKFRILDNKTNEFAGWDFDLLDAELEGLDFEGFDFDLNAMQMPEFDEQSIEEQKHKVVARCVFEYDSYKLKEQELKELVGSANGTISVKME